MVMDAPLFNVPIAIAQAFGVLLLLTFLIASRKIVKEGYLNWHYLLAADLWAINQSAFLVTTLFRKLTGSSFPDAIFLNNWSSIVSLHAIITITSIAVLLLLVYRKQDRS